MIARAYTYFRVLSLDVVLGSVFTAVLLGYGLGVCLSFYTLLVLGLVVWLVYTLDHLLDANEIEEQAVSMRHRFHQENAISLLIVWLVVLGFSCYLVVEKLSFLTIQLGVLAAALVVAHLVLVKLFGKKLSLIVQKEFGVALIFTLGVIIPSLSEVSSYSWKELSLMLQIFLLAFLNLIEFSWFERLLDELQGHSSLARVLGDRKTLRLADLIIVSFFIVALSTITLALLWANDELFRCELLLVIMAGVLSLIRYKSVWFQSNEKYRVWGDLVFSFPIILILVDVTCLR